MVPARCCTDREGSCRLKDSVTQARLPWGYWPLVLGSFRPLGLKVEVLFLFPKTPGISVSELQEKNYTPWSAGGGRWCFVKAANRGCNYSSMGEVKGWPTRWRAEVQD